MILKVKTTTEVEIRLSDSKATINLTENENAIREALEKLLSQMAPNRAEDNGDSRSSEAEPRERI